MSCIFTSLFKELGKNLNRGPVAQDHSNLDWALENVQTIAQVATEILNTSCTKLIAGPQEYFLGY